MKTYKKIFLTCNVLFIGMLQLSAQKTGVLLMAHGGSQQWQDMVAEASKPVAKKYPVAVAWGMADPNTLQKGVDELEAQGVDKIIAVPLFISSYSVIIRQNEFLFGLRDKLADPPMMMNHGRGAGSGHSMAGNSSKMNREEHHHHAAATLEPLHLKAQIILTHALDDHEVVAEILKDRIAELSINPAKETVVLVAHGPNAEEDNTNWTDVLISLTQKIEKLQENSGSPAYKQIFGITVRDDAPKEIADQATAQLRSLVKQAGNSGDVIVVPVFLSSGGREKAVAERLEGLTFKWSGKTLLPDNRLSDFIMDSVEDAQTAKNK